MDHSRTQGRRVGLTRDSILAAAVALTDREGMAALSMRRLGGTLGVEAMTIYHYVSNKDALLDGIVEHVVAGAWPDASSSTWDTAMRALADGLTTALLDHPQVIPLLMARPALTAETAAGMEQCLEVLVAAGFDADTANDCLRCLTAFVVGHAAARTAVAAPAGDAMPGPLLAAGIAAHAPAAQARQYEFGLRSLLTGFTAALDGDR